MRTWCFPATRRWEEPVAKLAVRALVPEEAAADWQETAATAATPAGTILAAEEEVTLAMVVMVLAGAAGAVVFLETAAMAATPAAVAVAGPAPVVMAATQTVA